MPDMNPNISNSSFYSFFTKYSLMDDYGFFSGLVTRLFKKILPAIPRKDTFEYFALKNKKDIDFVLQSINLKDIHQTNVPNELNLSIKALCSKIVAFGLDHDIYEKFVALELDTSPFDALFNQMSSLDCCTVQQTKELNILLDEIETSIQSLRKFKKKIGVNLHLTMVTRRILEYIERTKELVQLKLDLNSERQWKLLIVSHIVYWRKRYSLRRFIVRHFDLMVLEIVEHTSNRGGKYIAENQKEYWGFFYKSLLGGGIIALFALLKVFLGTYELSEIGYAIVFSLNYAICFILVKELGGIIATKQPAMTASTIAHSIDKNDNLEIDSIKQIISVIKKALSSQFISVVGNFVMALFFSSFTYKMFQLGGANESLGIDPDYLLAGVRPSFKLVSYAAVAGVFLALAGLISGYIDNKIISSQISFRMANSRLFFKSKRLANFVGNRGGIIIGNFSLGVFLGSAFLLSYIVVLPVDIRHIAFSSAYTGYALMSKTFGPDIWINAFLGIFIIGFTNLIVSFSITLLLALKSRGADISLLPRLFWYSLKDFAANPIDYFFMRNKKSTNT